VVAGILLLGVLALLIGYLLIGQAGRDKLRRGTPWTALSFPGALVLTVVFAIAGEELEGPARTALVVGCVSALGLFVAYRRRRLEVDPPPPPPPPPVEELPDEYRFRDGGGSIAGWGIPMVILFAGNIAFDGSLAAAVTLGSAALAAAIGLVVVFRRRRERRRAIMDSVEGRAAGLPREDLRTLVELLEAEHGRFEMRRLRRLVA